VNGESKWKGYEVVDQSQSWQPLSEASFGDVRKICSLLDGRIFCIDEQTAPKDGLLQWSLAEISPSGQLKRHRPYDGAIHSLAAFEDGVLYAVTQWNRKADGFRLQFFKTTDGEAGQPFLSEKKWGATDDFAVTQIGRVLACSDGNKILSIDSTSRFDVKTSDSHIAGRPFHLVLSPDQTLLYASDMYSTQVSCFQVKPDGNIANGQLFVKLETPVDGTSEAEGLCVDTEGRLYVATSLGIQVCDQAGRVNFIIPAPKPPHDVCFGGKDLTDLYIACGDTIYKRPTKAHGIVSGQMPPIKPAPPKL
jgi:hypothetical protein